VSCDPPQDQEISKEEYEACLAIASQCASP
jgi:hypothetical protein